MQGSIRSLIRRLARQSRVLGSNGRNKARLPRGRPMLPLRRLSTRAKWTPSTPATLHRTNPDIVPPSPEFEPPISSTPAESPHDRERLTAGQERVLEAILEGESVFFTGAAGTGKSYLLQRAIDILPRDGTVVTASTGRAAVQLGGTTLHSFAGIGIGMRHGTILHDLLRRARRPDARRRWQAARTLVVDEVSMLDAATFDALELIAREIRENEAPFGGIQLVLSGDFLQLPPVSKHGRIVTKPGTPEAVWNMGVGAASVSVVDLSPYAPGLDDARQCFAFQAESWTRAVPHAVELLEPIRHEKDPKFAGALRELRYGVVSEATQQLMASRVASGDAAAATASALAETGQETTRIYATRALVDAENTRMLAALPGHSVVFSLREGSSPITDQDDGMVNATSTNDDSIPVPARLELKKGAQVLLVRNVDPARGLVNGARGTVVGFEPFSVEAAKRAERAQRRAERAREREKGVGRQRTNMVAPVDHWADVAPGMQLPVVEFTNGERVTIKPSTWTNLGGIVRHRGGPRSQLPLILGWALTIHRCQGMTIDRAQISLRGSFEVGQAYTALSRVRSLQELTLLDFDPEVVRADPDAIAFHLSLSAAVGDEAHRKRMQERPAAAALAPMPPAESKRLVVPDLIGTSIPKPTKEELKSDDNANALLRRLYTRKGRGSSHSQSLRSMVLEYDPLAMVRHWARIRSGAMRKGVPPETPKQRFERLKQRAGIELPEEVIASQDVVDFLQTVIEQKEKRKGDGPQADGEQARSRWRGLVDSVLPWSRKSDAGQR